NAKKHSFQLPAASGVIFTTIWDVSSMQGFLRARDGNFVASSNFSVKRNEVDARHRAKERRGGSRAPHNGSSFYRYRPAEERIFAFSSRRIRRAPGAPGRPQNFRFARRDGRVAANPPGRDELRQRLLTLDRGSATIILAGRPKWRNWQTRCVQGAVGFTPVWVQIPPSAPGTRKTAQPSGFLLFGAPSPNKENPPSGGFSACSLRACLCATLSSALSGSTE